MRCVTRVHLPNSASISEPGWRRVRGISTGRMSVVAKMGRHLVVGRLAGLCLLILLSATPSGAVEITLDRPGDREFIRDAADLLTAQDEADIRTRCDKLLTDKATPILVITIKSMREHGGDGMRIETFTRLLFDQWQIGHAQLNGQLWNTGILVLVSEGDRKARIELGAGWKRDKDQLCQQIMDQQIIPHFKQKDFSGGIKAGVVALDAMARELQMPVSQQAQAPAPWWAPWAVAGLIGLAIFTVVSLVRQGSSGWAWLFWGALFSLLGYMLYQMLTNQGRRGGSSGGFSGGSFGGGFSGGGGASGSW